MTDDPLKPWRAKHRRGELDEPAALATRVAEGGDLRGLVVQGLDLSGYDLGALALAGAVLLGCRFRDDAQRAAAIDGGAAVFPELGGLPYEPYRRALYTVDELLEGYEAGGYVATRDFRIFAHYDRERRDPGGVALRESLAQRLHDLAIDDALQEVLEAHAGRGVVAVMGGHGTPRSDSSYRAVAELTWRLTRAGYLVASGGGPGVMEAANLGAWLACYARIEVVEAAVALLERADRFHGGEREGTPAYLDAIRAYFAAAHEAVRRLGPEADVAAAFERDRPGVGRSVAIPTWFYGHEPTNLFATHVAKYFSNSLREDGLLAIATAGVVYAPGSAGTLQEVFMDLAQNHYATYCYRSPMVFLGRARWASVFALLQTFVRERGAQQVYGDLLALVDTPAEAARFIEEHPPRLRPAVIPLYELT